MGKDLQELLRSLRVWSPEVTELRGFDPATAPPTPLPLFTTWLSEAAEAGQPEPHTMSLATTDEEGRPDVRIVMLHGADEKGWSFATHEDSAKGRQLRSHPNAALAFYWPVHARQIRIRGAVTKAPATDSQADLHARSTAALAAALTGNQSKVLVSLEELRRASEASWARAAEDPTATVPTWTLYHLDAEEVEFFQGDAQRRHVRLKYRRGKSGWTRELLWP